MFTISKRFDFSASHQLDGLPDDHPCSRLHGHNYSIEVELQGPLDDVGFVFDYRRLDPVKAMLDETLDHRHLNDVLLFNPTAENLARWIHTKARLLLGFLDRPEHDAGTYDEIRISAVRVYETLKTCAEYRP